MVVVGGQHKFFARRDAVTAHIRRDCTREHVARHIVVAVDQRPLVRAGSQHHTFGSHPVHALANHADGRAITEVIGQALVDGQKVVIVITVDRGAR